MKKLVPAVFLVACGSSGGTHSLDQTAIRQQNAGSTRGTPPTQIPPRCQKGMVSSDGPLGGPLEQVRIRVTVDDKASYEAVSNREGIFVVCLEKRGLFSHGTYDDRDARIKLEIEHRGYEPSETLFKFDSSKNDSEPSLRIILRRSKT